MAAREQLHSAIQATASEDDDLEGSVLVGWVTIAEWSAPDGRRWLSTLAGDRPRRGRSRAGSTTPCMCRAAMTKTTEHPTRALPSYVT